MVNEKIDVKDIYSNLVQLTIHSEEIAWNRFNSFLLASSILIIAWATIYVAIDIPDKKIILLAICCFGFLISLFFSGLGYRSRRFLQEHIRLGEYIEADPNCWPNSLNQKYKPFNQIVSIRDNSLWGICGGRIILVFGPLLFAVFYLLLIYFSQQ